MLYSDRSSEDEQLLMRPSLVKDEEYEHGGRLIFKLTFCYMDTTQEPLHLDRRGFVQ
jgi:hypothetical protein